MAYEEGVDAYYDHCPMEDNPYSHITEEFIMWNKGWLKAYDDEQELEETQE